MTDMTDRFRPLRRGDWVHCMLYGGKDGVIVDIRGEQSPLTCQSIMNGVGVTGGSAQFAVAWENATISMVSEALLRTSVQWSLPDRPPVSEEEVVRMQAATQARTQRDAQDTLSRRAEFDRAVATLLTEHPYLKPLSANDKHQSPGKFVAANLRIELKRAFPKTKFSVRSDYNSVNVTWEDGPTQGEVDALIDRYKTGRYHADDDYHDSEETPWTTAFGGTDYVFSHRDLSVGDAYPHLIEALYRTYPGNMSGIQRSTTHTMRASEQEIAGLGITVREALRTLSRYWNATTRQIVATPRMPHWVARVMEQQTTTPASKSVSDMSDVSAQSGADASPDMTAQVPNASAVAAPSEPGGAIRGEVQDIPMTTNSLMDDENSAYNGLC